MDAQTKAVELTVSGTVQGVDFRQWTVREATRLGLGGWVRNNTDRTVTILAEGPIEPVETFIERVKQGPSYGQVEGVDVRDAEVHGYSGFIITQ